MAETSLYHMMNSAYILPIIRILLSILSEKYVLGLCAQSPALCYSGHLDGIALKQKNALQQNKD